MKTVHLSKKDIGGGAARAAYRLHTEMIKEGGDSKMFVLNQEKIGDEMISTTSTFSRRISSIFRDFVNSTFSRFLNKSKWTFSIDLLGINVSNYNLIRDSDVIFIHWVNGGFMTLKNIVQVLRLNKKVIFVLHDMWFLTGGCHHSFECKQYIDAECRDCPLMNSSLRKRIIHYFYKRKSRALSKYSNFTIVTPSKWLGECANNVSFINKNSSFVIPNPIDLHIFKQIPKNIAKDIFSISRNTKLLLFVADLGTDNPYKGWSFLEEALIKLYGLEGDVSNLELLVLGSNRNDQIEQTLPYKVHFAGRLFDEYSLSLVYNAADVFITPSLADNLPSTVVESISCGTPAVGFNIGGIPDIIQHKKNGYLVKYKDVDDLINGIVFALEHLDEVKIDSYFATSTILKQYYNMINQLE